MGIVVEAGSLMANRGVQEWYYTRNLPSRYIVVAQVSTSPVTPADLTDVLNTPYLPGDLSVRKSTTSDASPADWIAPDLMQTIAISGAAEYRLYDQFFELTNVVAADNTPMYYSHPLSEDIQTPVIIDLDNNIVTTTIFRNGDLLYHSLDGAPYRLRYVDTNGFLHTDLLKYSPTVQLNQFSVSPTTFTYGGRDLSVFGISIYYLRFTQRNGYLILPPYNAQPNTPWYPRVRFSLTPVAPEWATQLFLPQRPYQLGTWIPGVVLDPHLIEFERKQMFYDPANLPDIIVFHADYSVKYALEGTLPGSPRRRGSLYNWQRGLTIGIDPYSARIEIAPELEPSDIVFGFYQHVEPDVVYKQLDVNPSTNPIIKNTVIQFYYKTNGQDPFHYIYHQVIDPVLGPIIGQTNDPAPNVGTNHIFSNFAIGAGFGTQNFTITDVRQRGGGLSTQYQSIPQAVNFWDLGFWDGKPYPIGGALALYAPVSILNTLTRADVEGKVQATLPMGVLAVIRYYDVDGVEVI